MYTENSRIYLVSISIVGYCSNQFQMIIAINWIEHSRWIKLILYGV